MEVAAESLGAVSEEAGGGTVSLILLETFAAGFTEVEAGASLMAETANARLFEVPSANEIWHSTTGSTRAKTAIITIADLLKPFPIRSTNDPQSPFSGCGSYVISLWFSSILSCCD